MSDNSGLGHDVQEQKYRWYYALFQVTRPIPQSREQGVQAPDSDQAMLYIVGLGECPGDKYAHIDGQD